MKLSLEHGVYFIGIGGISMSSLAKILHEKGIKVGGYDFKCTETTKALEQDGIPVQYTYAPHNQDGYGCVVYTAAIKPEDPELVLAKKNGVTLLSRAQLLGELMKGYTHAVGVAGTHGKSTTTGMLCHIFETANADATILAGAVIPSLNSTYRSGKGDVAVFEACEYKNSYHAMRPTIRLVLNCELDHVDFFGNMQNVIKSFHTYMQNTSETNENIAVINKDSDGCLKAAEHLTDTKLFTFSATDVTADFYADNLCEIHGYEEFDIYAMGKYYCHVKLGVPGLHNVYNAVASASCAYLCGVDGKAVETGLGAFGGVKRRFEKLGVTHSGACVIDDYAHHPDEVTATLTAAKKICQGKVYCLFQPHTYSRFEALMPDFAKALALADQVVMADIYAAREQNVHGTHASDIKALLPTAAYVGDFQQIADYVNRNAQKNDMVITMGAGDVYKIAPLILA